jgi:hypothetical protein
MVAAVLPAWSLLPLGCLQERWPAAKEQELRNHLGSFGIKGATATQPLPTLSGALAGLVVRLLAWLSGCLAGGREGGTGNFWSSLA